jgi:OOP family OmpA-OmpF porin
MARQKLWSACAVLILLNISAGAASAYAGEDGYYFGLGVGATIIDKGTTTQILMNDVTAAGFASADVGLDRKSTGYKVLGGYQFNRNFAVEGFYADLGTYDFNVSTTHPASHGNGNTRINAYGFDLLGMIPINQTLTGFGRFGIYRREATGSFDIPGAAPSFARDITSNAKVGAGLEWNVATSVNLRTEWEYYDNSDAAVSLLSVGLVSHF